MKSSAIGPIDYLTLQNIQGLNALAHISSIDLLDERTIHAVLGYTSKGLVPLYSQRHDALPDPVRNCGRLGYPVRKG